MNKNKFFESLINATDKKQVEQILKLNQKFYGTRYVDDDDNNEGGIEVLGNAVSGFAERCTNMFNANILFKVQKKGMEKQLQGKSARKAVELLYDVPDGRMSNMNASSKEYKDLSDMSMVILEDSDKATQPTVTFRDSGIGIKGSDFSKSILNDYFRLRSREAIEVQYDIRFEELYLNSILTDRHGTKQTKFELNDEIYDCTDLRTFERILEFILEN